jgi:endonuclease YncB( thermonuclease family)
MRHPRPLASRLRRHAGALVLGATFTLGLALGAAVKPALTDRLSAPVLPAFAAAGTDLPQPNRPRSRVAGSNKLAAELVYPAEVVRIIDGDTFEARVRVWPGLDVDTKVRLRGIDAAELHARCAGELAQAQAARAALQAMLAEGAVTVSRVGVDKYGGRIDAAVATRSTADVSAAMLAGGFARAYDGGRRRSWC